MRDAMLAVSGKLSLTPPLGSPITSHGEGSVLITFRTRPVDTENFALTWELQRIYVIVGREPLISAAGSGNVRCAQGKAHAG